MTLPNQDTGMMDTFRQPELVDTGLQPSLQEIFNLERQDVIEFHAGLVQDSDTDETADEGISFEEPLGIFLIKSQKLTGRSMLGIANQI